MAEVTLRQLIARHRKRVGYLQKYHLPTGTDETLQKLNKAIRIKTAEMG